MPPSFIASPTWISTILLSVLSRVKKNTECEGLGTLSRFPTYSVFIPAWNEKETIREALASLSRQTVKPSKVLILDDNSECSYQEAVASTFPEARIIRSNHRAGKAANITEHLDKVNSDYLLILDADSSLSPSYMEKILARS